MKKILLMLLNMAMASSLFVFSSTASAQLGSAGTDLVYSPVTPCRIMDTRNPGAKSGILVAGTTRGFWSFAGGSDFTTQGGTASNCGVLSGANLAAIVVNFTVVTPDIDGYITAFPAGATRPTAATVNFKAGSVVGNNASLKVAQVGGGDGFSIYTTSNVHVVADIVGFYSMPVSAGSLLTTNVTLPAVNVPANSYAYLGTLTCTAGYTAVSVGFSANNDVLMADGYAYNNQGYIYVRNVSASTQSVTPNLLCIKLSGR